MTNYKSFYCLVFATLLISGSGCGRFSFSSALSSEETTTDSQSEASETLASGASSRNRSEDVHADLGVQAVSERFGELFQLVLPTLDQARELVDRHANLPDSSIVPFTSDKQSNSAQINELLDQAIEVLSLSEVSDYRQRIRDANAAIAASYANIADYRRQRVSASWAKDQSQLDRVNPFELSKEALDQSIVDEEARIKGQQEELAKLKKRFADELSRIGVEVDEAGIESLLSSVSGDDVITMAVVFDNIKLVTHQLQDLTEQSGEALDVSKRYYGMYVVMIHVMDRIQKSFVRDINEKHIPKLEQFASQARQNMDQAEALIKVDGGDRKMLEANIASNELTRATAVLYIEYLRRNAELISAENARAQKNLATAMNTYDTVKLSSDVASLMNTGRRDFEALMKLQVPALREFSNEAMRKEFQRMTSELRAGE